MCGWTLNIHPTHTLAGLLSKRLHCSPLQGLRSCLASKVMLSLHNILLWWSVDMAFSHDFAKTQPYKREKLWFEYRLSDEKYRKEPFAVQKVLYSKSFHFPLQLGNPSSTSSSTHHEPMVAMICPEKSGDKLGKLYHNQYLNADGKWTTDFDHKATCRQDKVEILEYCKKVCIILTLLNFLTFCTRPWLVRNKERRKATALSQSRLKKKHGLQASLLQVKVW